MGEQSFEHECQLIVFRLAEEEYGIEIAQVQEIIKLVPITRVPHTPYYISGVINLRGNIIPVIDLRKKLNLNNISELNERSRIIVVEIEDIVAGFIVDEVFEVLRLAEADIEPPPEGFSGAEKRYVKGIGKKDGRLIILLSLGELVQKA